jgi:agmatine deiminase
LARSSHQKPKNHLEEGLAPIDLGLRMPAEWEPHAATWLAWPHYRGDWPGKFEPIPWVYAEIIRNLAKHERVELIVNNAAAARQARSVLERADVLSNNIRFHHWRTDRVWLRDSGCIFVKCGAGAPTRVHSREGSFPHESREGHVFTRAASHHSHSRTSVLQDTILALKFRFNAWAKYSNWRNDDNIGSLMAKVAVSTLRKSRRVGHPPSQERKHVASESSMVKARCR